MSYLVDRGIGKSSVPPAWTSFVMVSVQGWQTVSGYLFALREL